MSETQFGEPVAWALYHDGIPSSTYDRLEVAQKTAAVYGAGWEVVPLYPAPNVAAIDGAIRALEQIHELVMFQSSDYARKVCDLAVNALAALGRATEDRRFAGLTPEELKSVRGDHEPDQCVVRGRTLESGGVCKTCKDDGGR